MRKIQRLVMAIMAGTGILLAAKSVLASDYGDAPAPYPTAQHDDTTFQWLGSNVSNEPGSRSPDTYDDGITWNPHQVKRGDAFDLTFEATSIYQTDVIVSIWLDWNGDGMWGDPSEQIVDWRGTVYPSGSGYRRSVTQTINVPITAVEGETWMRARLNWASSFSAPDMSPTAYQVFGECEDYQVSVVPEPATIALLGLGCAPVLVRRRRQSRPEDIQATDDGRPSQP